MVPGSVRNWIAVKQSTSTKKEIKNMTTPHLRKSIGRSPLWRAFLLIPLVFACFALVQLPAAGMQNGVLDWGNTPLEPAIITFDAPGAGTGPNQGTVPEDINPAETISGIYRNASLVNHGFVRAPNGAVTTFDVPGGGTGPFQGTGMSSVDCLNPAGAIVGPMFDSNDAFHGYLRAPNGMITVFDVPGAGTGSGQGTYPTGINQAGTIQGFYVDSSNVYHGFVRAPKGAFTTFDVPGAGTGPGQGTIGFNINAPGAITGPYVDGSDVNHGFLRAKNGAITTFDVPGAGTGPGQGTIPSCNNPVDAITGDYIDSSNVAHGFLRTP